MRIYFYFIALISLFLLSCVEIEEEKILEEPKSVISDGYLPSLNNTIEIVSPSVVAINTSTDALDRFFITRVRSADGSGVIISNDGSKKNQGFNSDYNAVSIIDKKGRVQSISKNKKSFIANKIAKIIVDKLLINDKNFN